uniref:Uncharacterized protein n=1 Tax=Helianthus annuus TaxID=4232 RepID=A0A251S8X9_HELAN
MYLPPSLPSLCNDLLTTFKPPISTFASYRRNPLSQHFISDHHFGTTKVSRDGGKV